MKNKLCIVLAVCLCVSLHSGLRYVFAQEIHGEINVAVPTKVNEESVQGVSRATPKVAVDKTPSKEFVRMAWEASSQGDLEKLKELAERCLKLYEGKAKEQQSQLSDIVIFKM
jgi:hypothetical protein